MRTPVYPGGVYNGPVTSTISVYVYDLFQTGNLAGAAAVSSLFLLIAFAIFIAVRLGERSGSAPVAPRGARSMSRWVAEGLEAGLDHFHLGPVDLEVGPGQAVAILGPSGAGKTTLLRALAGFLPLQNGRILRDGEEVSDWLPEERRLGYVPQGLGLFSHRTVARNIRYPMELQEGVDATRRTQELLQRFHLTPLADRYPARLSGGEQQRVALARALAAEPELILWDEPWQALDVLARHELGEILHDIRETERVPVVVVTHDPALAFSIADSFVVLRPRVELRAIPYPCCERPPMRLWPGCRVRKRLRASVARGGSLDPLGGLAPRSGRTGRDRLCDAPSLERKRLAALLGRTRPSARPDPHGIDRGGLVRGSLGDASGAPSRVAALAHLRPTSTIRHRARLRPPARRGVGRSSGGDLIGRARAVTASDVALLRAVSRERSVVAASRRVGMSRGTGHSPTVPARTGVRRPGRDWRSGGTIARLHAVDPIRGSDRSGRLRLGRSVGISPRGCTLPAESVSRRLSGLPLGRRGPRGFPAPPTPSLSARKRAKRFRSSSTRSRILVARRRFASSARNVLAGRVEAVQVDPDSLGATLSVRARRHPRAGRRDAGADPTPPPAARLSSLVVGRRRRRSVRVARTPAAIRGSPHP